MSKKSESFSTGVMDAQSQAIINDITHATPEQEPIHKLSQNQVAESRGVMLKHVRTLPDSNLSTRHTELTMSTIVRLFILLQKIGNSLVALLSYGLKNIEDSPTNTGKSQLESLFTALDI